MKSKRTKGAKRHSKLLLKLSSWGNYIDEAYQLESMLAKKPARLQIEFVGSGEIPPDSALLMRSMLLKRSPQTRIVTNARSSLQGATLLIWLLGDTRLIREDARFHFRPAGPFVADDASTGWKDRSCFDADDMEEEDYVRVLHAINEFLPVKELAGRPVEASVLKEFGLIDNVGGRWPIGDRLWEGEGAARKFADQYQEGVAKRGQPVTATKTAALMPGYVGTCGRRPSSPPAQFKCPVGRAAQAAVCKTAQVSATLTRDSIFRA